MARGDGNPASSPGWHVHTVDSTGSTNDDLAAMAAAGAPDRTVLVARHQTAGRGRLDRRWDAPPGTNLLASLLFRDPGGVHVAGADVHTVHTVHGVHTVVQRLALAARAACRTVAAVDVALKWPNDLLVGERKLAGILAQRLADGSVVAGIGLNVRWCPPGAARLGAGHDPMDVLAATLAAYDELGDDVAASYRSALATLGQEVRVDAGDRQLEGTAVDVDADGRLLVRTADGRVESIDAGDVVHVRRAPPPPPPRPPRC